MNISPHLFASSTFSSGSMRTKVVKAASVNRMGTLFHTKETMAFSQAERFSTEISSSRMEFTWGGKCNFVIEGCVVRKFLIENQVSKRL